MSVGIITFHSANNYGAVLQCYALSEVLKRSGYEGVSLIDLPIRDVSRGWRSTLRAKLLDNSFSDFRRDHLPAVVDRSVKKSIYVFGSDQVWNPQITKNNTPLFFGAWADEAVPKVAYAASFGLASWEFPVFTGMAQELLDTYQAVGVRESSGVDICREEFSVEAEKVVDPTLLLTDYSPVFKRRKASESLACYIFGKNEGNLKELKVIASSRGLKPVLLNDFRWRRGVKSVPFPTVSNWLSYVESSKMVLTDSFHCMVFSIIFRKDFIAIPAIPERAGRMLSLLEDLGLESRFFSDISEVNSSGVLENPVDFDEVHHRLEALRGKSLSFLEGALAGA